jgi:hypothetical protein
MKAAGYDVHDVPRLWHTIDELPVDKRPDSPTLTPSAGRRAAVMQAIEKADALVSTQAKASVSTQ